MKLTRKKIISYISNLALVIIILILFVPSWRVAFQGWFQGIFMDDIQLEVQSSQQIPQGVRRWEIFDLNSQIYSFEEFSGKPIILSFWATWCSYCRPEMKEINELKLQYGDKMNYVSVSDEDLEIIENSGLGEDYDFLYFTPSIPSYLEVNSYPTLLILNKDMEIIYRHTGAGGLNTEENKSFFDRLIAGEI